MSFAHFFFYKDSNLLLNALQELGFLNIFKDINPDRHCKDFPHFVIP